VPPLTALNGSLVITGSRGQGIVALNDSHATLTGAMVTGGSHAGLVAANLTSIDVSQAPRPHLWAETAWIYFAMRARQLPAAQIFQVSPPLNAQIYWQERLWLYPSRAAEN
jgi:hypothetical protein